MIGVENDNRFDEVVEETYDFDDIEEVNLYNHDYPMALEYCDKRVYFSSAEKIKLQSLNSKLFNLYQSIEEVFKESSKNKEFERPENQRPIYKKALPDIAKYEKLAESARKIQLNAENRFMKKTFGTDVRAIAEDALSIIENEKYNRLPIVTRDYLFGKTPEVKVKALFNATLYLARMHSSYMVEIGELESLVNSVESKIREYVQNDEALIAVVEVIKIEIINDENNKYNYSLDAADQYEMILQAPPLAALSMMSTKKASNFIIDSQYKTATVQLNGLDVIVEDYLDENHNTISSLDVLTLQFIDMLIIEFNKNGRNNSKLVFSVEDYMKRRGIKVIQKAREQIINSSRNIYNLTLHYSGTNEDNSKYKFKKLKIITSLAELKNGNIEVNLNPDFCNIIKDYSIMKYPKKLFMLNEIKNPNSYYLLKKLIWHKNINFKNRNSDLISVDTLLNVCPNLSEYNEISKTGQIRQRIIEPFERDMNELIDVLTWEYYSSNGILDINDVEIDYNTFSKLKIRINWKHYSKKEK